MVDGEADGEAVEADLALGAAVLLHERHDDGALVVVVVVVGILERDAELRIHVERGCSARAAKHKTFPDER